ncbi:hypothetical protein AWJ20_1330 [Sugiyamaella lignohabitans]|uniref:Uncharacterized protein n=1 Tax=Sugiyamaella lignohabitans TaxID=796027 RepID=A0A167DLS7_9ASCO|nr:uncharacterized protein AWJ20_1330 [Sugiyamaella lignohabitans]ANB13052.1 hypothetical protein AWJ20_1330 [Sugiyamaella lignohabitans]
MSIQAYLDSTFSSFEDLKAKVDAESARLKSEETALAGLLDSERATARAQAQESVSELKAYIKQLSSDIKDHKPPPELLKSASLPPDLLQKLNGVKSLLHAKIVVSQLRELQSASNELKQVLAGNNAKSVESVGVLELYNKVACLIEELEANESKHFQLDKLKSPGSAESQSPKLKVIDKLVSRSFAYVNDNVLDVVANGTKDKLRTCLEEHGWPNEDAFGSSNPAAVIEFQNLFINVLKTEYLGKAIKSHNNPLPPVISAFTLLVEAEVLRFNFHFESDKATNRVDKPEWMFSWVANTIDNHKNFLMNILQPALISVPRFHDRIAVHEFITALLPVVYNKLANTVQELAKTIISNEVTSNSYLLSHLVHEIVSFDELLKERYYFTPYNLPNWNGLAGDVLTEECFKVWLDTEKKIALQRYQEILDMPNSWEIDWDIGEGTKPTISAINIKDLFESVTEQYSALRKIRYRLRFLLEIQIHILDKFYIRLSESISAFESMTSSLSRAVGGVSAEDKKLVSGVDGLERLCRIYGSLSYIISALGEWGEDLFFLDLWEHVSKVSSKDRHKDSHSNENQETLFDETIHSYLEKKQKVYSIISGHVRKELRQSLQECYQYSEWTFEDDNTSGDRSITPKLVRPIQSLSTLLTFLRRFFSANDYSRFSGLYGAELSRYIWDNVIQVNRFTVTGANQLQRDVNEMWTAWLLPRDKSLRRLEEACSVLVATSKETQRIISDESTVDIKQKLGLSVLTPADIRSIIPRRKH